MDKIEEEIKLRKIKTLSFYDWCINNKRQDLIDRWDYELNECGPNIVSYQSGKKMYFKCLSGKHRSTAFKLQSIVLDGNSCTCYECKLANDSFGKWCDDNNKSILDLWDYNMNNVSPYEIMRSTKEKMWFKCPRGIHDSELKIISNITYRGYIPLCTKCNSFGQYLIDQYGEDTIDILWDFDKNNEDPFEIARSARKKVYLKCLDNLEHPSYPIWCSNYLKGEGCPNCKQERECSKLQEKVNLYINKVYNYRVLHEHNCTIKARNPKTKHILPYDNQVMISENINLIIEVHGIQHYKADNYTKLEARKHGVSPEEELVEIQWRDEYKKQYALSKGYYYLVIPYWTEQDESYKTLIDEKIKSILTTQN